MGAEVSYRTAVKLAHIYSRTGCAKTAGETINRGAKTARGILRDFKDRCPEIARLVGIGRELALENGYRKSQSKRRTSPHHVRNDLALKRDREIHSLRASQPSPTTIGQQLLGEPLPGRSALDKINANKRRDSAKADPRFISRVFGTDYHRRNVVTLPNIQLGQGS